MALISPSRGQTILHTHISQFTNLIGGVANSGQAVAFTQHSDAADYANKLGNVDATNGFALKIQYGPAATPTTIATFAKAAITFVSPVSMAFSDGSLAAPSIAFSGDVNTGLRRVSADYWALVAGGADAIRIKGGTDAPFAPRVGLGNVDEPGATDNPENLLHVHYSGSANSNGVVGITTSITDNASAVRAAPSVVPDMSGISSIIAQTSGTATGAGRAYEGHAIRATTSTSGDSWMIAEFGMHTGAAGNASFGALGGGVPKTMGIWLSSYQDSVMSGLAVTAVEADCGLYINEGNSSGSAGGFRYPIAYDYFSGATLTPGFRMDNSGNIAVGTNNNSALVGYGFVGDTDTGMFWAGANVPAISAGGTELQRWTGSAASITAGLILAGEITPTTLAANTDNWTPSGIGPNVVIRASTDAARNLTGLLALPNGTVVCIQNVGAQNLVLVHDATSTAANRFLLPNNVNLTLLPNMSALLRYDNTSARWRMLAGFVS